MLCPNCFEENITGKCSNCGYTYDPSTASDDVLEPGLLLNNRYRVGRCIGQGGFGVTYLAKDTFKDILCCIKEYYPNQIVDRLNNNYLTVHDESMRSKFENGKKCFIDEAKVLFKLQSCPLVVTVTDFFSEFNSAYIVMDYLDGMNLKRALNKFGGVLSYNNSLQVLYQISNALVEVHKAGILHRDISPENIFITKDGKIILIDFGAARNRDSEGMSVLIKPGYAPPEQYKYDGKQGPWTDIYALASTFYYIVSGKHITPARERLIEDNMPPLFDVAPSVGKELSNVIEKAMMLDYTARYQNVYDFLNDVQNAVNVKSTKKVGVIKFISGISSGDQMAIPDGKTINIGRLPNPVVNGMQYHNDKIVKSGNISGRHCTIHYTASSNEFVVVDYSTNGTYFQNGTRLCYGMEYKLKPGDVIVLVNSDCCAIEFNVKEVK